jgi:hypothetical protein
MRRVLLKKNKEFLYCMHLKSLTLDVRPAILEMNTGLVIILRLT